VHDKDENEYYCSNCWHRYPTGFKCSGWDFVRQDDSVNINQHNSNNQMKQKSKDRILF